MSALSPKARRPGIRVVLVAVVGVALVLLLVWPHIPTNAVPGSVTVVRDSARILPGETLTLISDMPTVAAEEVSQTIEEQTGAAVNLMRATGADSGDVPLRSAVAKMSMPSAPSHVVVWVGWGDLWSGRAGLRDSATRALDAIRERFPAARLAVVGPVPSASDDARVFGVVDVMLGRAARAANVTYISGVGDSWSAPVTGKPVLSGHALAEDLISAIDG